MAKVGVILLPLLIPPSEIAACLIHLTSLGLNGHQTLD